MTTHPDPVRETPEAYPAAPVQPNPAAAASPVAPPRHAAAQEATDWTGGVDTVPAADGSPDELQPYAELGLRDDEYDRIRHILGRRPTQSELAMYSIMWSEHCSYKSSKVHLRQFGEKAPPSDRLLAGIGENAGVVQISDELAVTFKVESHNHPSFVEPYQGAATGVGGIVRDILAMGARPVAVMDPLRFGAADHPDTARVLPGVVAGVGGYGNCLGLPNIGGEVVFDPCYQGNPLVNALCLGVLPVSRLQNKAAVGPGNVVVLMGAKTGRDGIGGVSVLASATFTEGSEKRRPSVQVGDPFIEKLLIEACLELYDAQLVAGIQDLGGAGLTCALTETAAAAGTGMRVWLERVPLREPSMEPHEILASESQERMLLVVEPDKLDAVLKTCEKWGVLATAIGEVTAPQQDGQPGRLLITWRDHLVVDVPPGSLVDDGPVYARPMREPADLILLQADRAETLPRPTDPDALRETLLRMIASPNLADKTWVTEQYDRYVLGNTVLAQPEDSGVIRIDEQTGLGVALSVDGNGRYARLDPYHGAKLALAEAFRNVAVTGATPIAVTDCLNFGSPEDPGVMWQFAEAVRGLADGCAELGIPVTGGNVSFYNQTGAAAIHPTPVVGVLGVLENVAERVASGFVAHPTNEHDQLFLLGETHVELSGSEWAWVTHEHLGGVPPQVDLTREKQLAGLLAAASRVGHLSSAHDLSDGGLAQSLVESCLRHNVGARIAVPERFEGGSMPFVFLFSESAGRVLVSVPRGHEKAFTALCAEHGVPWELIGVTDSTAAALEVHGQFRVELDELREAHTGTLPKLFGGVQPFEVTAPEAVGTSAQADVAPTADAAEAAPVVEAAPTADATPETADVVDEVAVADEVPATDSPVVASEEPTTAGAEDEDESVAERPAERATPPVRANAAGETSTAGNAPVDQAGAEAPQPGATEQPAASDER
ncbi:MULTISPECIES: phosphoribosylformylglycinamidine synthase subunit PurL [unclassified Micromonospora]|uniref:phosphoribosylformylglycinamidine synthase subunit PurL n=1 Tax=unclassified Micromonospora TaxID=2617518 RepID=UPI0010348E60|nr:MULTISPECIES: phosphoribosylformylglycinamidine synthase subunit PurL [unclassified Micromonospora]QKW11487.1 phosphoribosylformylglycinamidine synthase subunit PurL [Verrucosispora sp. NA02020]QKW11611.1 phosphoribosylformylglycinamidine synthase subunit PurL [Verrucosispora sp. NA02020]TBL43233.1 phosphoribosylformylglycinamidine synthase subunit PurL [Verrucosispora sp. SN26_14.1]